MNCPDVKGFSYGKAKQLLEEKGYNIAAVTTLKPPRDNDEVFDDSYRVVRLKLLGVSTIELLVCRPL